MDRPIHLKKSALESALKSRAWFFLALFSAILVAFPLLTTPGLINTRGGGDSPFLLVRTYQVAQGLRAGQLPVRWMDSAAYGLGYPFFSFYAALPYYLAALLHLSGLGILWAIKLTQLIGFVAAAAGIYALARRWLDSSPPAALAAIAYTFAPFHIVNVYVRGDSLSEFYAFVWYPLILLCLHRLFRKPSAARAGALALTFAALVATHNISAMIFSPFLLLYGLVLILDKSISREQKLKAIAQSILALILAALLSAWLWLPALGELDAVQLGEAQIGGYFHYSNHFRSHDLVQPAVWFDYDPDTEPSPFAMGLIQAILILAGIAALLWRWFRRRKFDLFGLLVLLALVIATLMITPLSRPLWDSLSLLALVQFPWRFLSVQAFAGSLIVGALATVLPRPRFTALLIGLALAFTALAGLHPEPLHITTADITPERLALYEYFTANIGTTIQAEYLPRDALPRPYTSQALLTAPLKPAPLALEGTLGSATLLEQHFDAQEWQIGVASEKARLIFHTLNFPGWQARVDGRPVEIESWPGLGYISLTLEQGVHQVRLDFGDSSLRQKADLLAAVGLALLLGLGVAARPWQGLARHHLWIIGTSFALIMILGLLCSLLKTSAAPPVLSDLTMDFIRQPYLHHNPAGVDFGEVRLSSYTLSADHAAAGDSMNLQLAWSGGQEGELEAQVDLVFDVHERLENPLPLASSIAAIPPGGGTTQHEITIPADAVRGIYFLRVWAVGPGGPLTPRTAQGKSLGSTYLYPLQITAYRPATGDEPILGQFGSHISLVGAQIEPDGDDRLGVTLTWRCAGQIAVNYDLALRIYDANALRLTKFQDSQPHRGLYPTVMWQPGELVTERHTLLLASETPIDQAQTLEVILYNRAAPELAPIGTAYIPVKERPRSFEIPPVQTPVGAEFGDQMRLLGYDLDQTTGALTLTLYWQAVQAMATDFKIFLHLFDPATEAIPVQDDAMPLRNTYPTRWWAEGEVVSDAISLPLADVPAGQYRLAVGVYDPATPGRLPGQDSQGAPLPNDRLILEAEITIP